MLLEAPADTSHYARLPPGYLPNQAGGAQKLEPSQAHRVDVIDSHLDRVNYSGIPKSTT